jgi:predicted ATPase
VVVGASGSGKTALAEAFLLLSDAAWGRAKWDGELRGVSVGIELEHGCAATCETNIDETVVQKGLEVRCPYVDVPPLMRADQLSGVVGAVFCNFLLKDVVVIADIDWKAVRGPQPKPFVRQIRLLPDASNFVPYLYAVTGGKIPDSLVEAVRYVMPDITGMWFEEDDGRLLLKFATEGGLVLDQTNAPSGVLKTLIVESALRADPMLVVVDEFENSLHPETQQFLMDEFRSHGVYAVLMTHSTVPLDYVKSPNEVVLLGLEGRETKARRLGRDVEERLKKSGLTLSELIWSGLL